MSLRAMLWAFDDAPDSLSSPERFVLLAIADHVDDSTGDAWPSIARIARRTGLSRSSVQTAVRILAQLGILDVVDQGAPVVRAETRPNLYRWHPDQLHLDLTVRTQRVGGRSRRVVVPVDSTPQSVDSTPPARHTRPPDRREGPASRPGGARQLDPNPKGTLREQADTGSHTPSPPQLAAACGRTAQHRPHTTTDGLCEGTS